MPPPELEGLSPSSEELDALEQLARAELEAQTAPLPTPPPAPEPFVAPAVLPDNLGVTRRPVPIPLDDPSGLPVATRAGLSEVDREELRAVGVTIPLTPEEEADREAAEAARPWDAEEALAQLEAQRNEQQLPLERLSVPERPSMLPTVSQPRTRIPPLDLGLEPPPPPPMSIRPPGPVPMQPLERGTPTPQGSGITDQIRAGAYQRALAEAELQQQYGGPGQQAAAALEGAARGATLGLSDPLRAAAVAAAEAALTDKTYAKAYADARREADLRAAANPITAGTFGLVGAVAPTLLAGPLGAGAGAAAGAAGVAEGAAAVGALARAGAAAKAGVGALGAPSRLAAGLGERAGAQLAGEGVMRGALSAGTAGAVEGITGGLVQGGSELFRPGYTPDQAAEDAVSQAATGGLLGGALGSTFGGIGGLLRKAKVPLEQADEIIAPVPLPEVEPVKVEQADLRKMAEDLTDTIKGAPRDSSGLTTSREAVEAADTRGKYEKRLMQVRMARGEYEEVLNREATEASKEVTELFRVSDRLDQKAGIAAKKAASEFDEVDSGPLFTPQARREPAQQELPLAAAAADDAIAQVEPPPLASREPQNPFDAELAYYDALAEDAPVFEIPAHFVNSRAARDAFEAEFAYLRGQLDGFVDEVGQSALLNEGGMVPIRRINRQLDAQEANINRVLSQGRIGDAYGFFDQGVKAFIGKEAQRMTRSRYVQEFLRELTVRPMHFLEGTDDAGEAITGHIWRAGFIDARPAVARVLEAMDLVRKGESAYAGSRAARDAVDLAASNMNRVQESGELTAWQSNDYLKTLRRELEEVVSNDALWDLGEEAAIRTRGELKHLLADGEIWEALSLGARQVEGNKPWSRRIGISQDAAWRQFFSVGPRRRQNDWDNIVEANDGAILNLFGSVGTPGALRNEQAFRMNLRAMAADAEARARAWGGEGTDKEARKMMELARTLEARLDLAAKARFDKEAGAAYLAGAPMSESVVQAAVALGAASTGPVGATLGAALYAPAAGRKIVGALAEAQAGTDGYVSKAARSLARNTRRGLALGEASADHVTRSALYLKRLASEKEVRQRIEEARALTDPASAASQVLNERAAEIEEVSPALADAYARLEERRAGYVTSKAPADGRIDPTSARKLTAIVTASYYPEKSIQRMADGVATAAEVDALRSVFPELYQRFVAEVEAAVEEYGEPKGRQDQTILFKMAGIATRSALEQDRLMKAQLAARPQPDAQPSPPPGDASQSFTMDPNRFATQADRIMSEER